MKQLNKNYFSSIEEFVKVLSLIRGDKKIVCTSGGFDPVHVGHLRCFKESAQLAASMGGLFVIIANDDNFLKRKKGKPFMPQEERLEILSEIKGVDYVVLWGDETQTSSGAIEKIKPDFFTKGGDRDEIKKIPESNVCDAINCKIIFGVGGGKVQSSSWLLENQEDD